MVDGETAMKVVPVKHGLLAAMASRLGAAATKVESVLPFPAIAGGRQTETKVTTTATVGASGSGSEEIAALARQTATVSSGEVAESGESDGEAGPGPKVALASPSAEKLAKNVSIATRTTTVLGGPGGSESATTATVGTLMAEISISIAEKRDAKVTIRRATKGASVSASAAVSSCNVGRLKSFRSQNSISS